MATIKRLVTKADIRAINKRVARLEKAGLLSLLAVSQKENSENPEESRNNCQNKNKMEKTVKGTLAPKANGQKMAFKGLRFLRVEEVPALRAIDTVVSYQTYSLGDGLWSIEAKTSYDQSCWGPSCMEWVGSNGTREEADDLWAEVEAWKFDPNGGLAIVRDAYKYRVYEAPDGCQGSYSFFVREAEAGRCHDLIIVL